MEILFNKRLIRFFSSALCLFISFSMVVSLLSLPVFAESASDDDSSIELEGDIESDYVSDAVEVSAYDSDGNVLTASVDSSDFSFTMSSYTDRSLTLLTSDISTYGFLSYSGSGLYSLSTSFDYLFSSTHNFSLTYNGDDSLYCSYVDVTVFFGFYFTYRLNVGVHISNYTETKWGGTFYINDFFDISSIQVGGLYDAPSWSTGNYGNYTDEIGYLTSGDSSVAWETGSSYDISSYVGSDRSSTYPAQYVVVTFPVTLRFYNEDTSTSFSSESYSWDVGITVSNNMNICFSSSYYSSGDNSESTYWHLSSLDASGVLTRTSAYTGLSGYFEVVGYAYVVDYTSLYNAWSSYIESTYTMVAELQTAVAALESDDVDLSTIESYLSSIISFLDENLVYGTKTLGYNVDYIRAVCSVISTRLGDLLTYAESLDSSVDDINGWLEDIYWTSFDIMDELSALDDITDILADLYTIDSSIYSSVDDVEAELQALYDKLSDIESNLDYGSNTLGYNVDYIRAVCSVISTRLGTLLDYAGSLDSTVTDIDDVLNEVSTTISAISDDLAVLFDIYDILGDLYSIDSSIYSSVDDVEAELQALYAKLSDIESNLVAESSTQILRGTNTVTELTSGSWSSGAWRSSGSSSGIRESIVVSDLSNISVGWLLTQTSGSCNISQSSVPVTVDQTYTLSCYAKGSGTLSLSYGVSPYSGSSFSLNNVDDWTLYSFTFTANSTYCYGGYSNFFFGCSAGSIEICGMKLELGSEATPWEPSVYDDDYVLNLADNVSYIRSICTTISTQLLSALDYLDSIDSTVADIDDVLNEVSSTVSSIYVELFALNDIYDVLADLYSIDSSIYSSVDDVEAWLELSYGMVSSIYNFLLDNLSYGTSSIAYNVSCIRNICTTISTRLLSALDYLDSIDSTVADIDDVLNEVSSTVTSIYVELSALNDIYDVLLDLYGLDSSIYSSVDDIYSVLGSSYLKLISVETYLSDSVSISSSILAALDSGVASIYSIMNTTNTSVEDLIDVCNGIAASNLNLLASVNSILAKLDSLDDIISLLNEIIDKLDELELDFSTVDESSEYIETINNFSDIVNEYTTYEGDINELLLDLSVSLDDFSVSVAIDSNISAGSESLNSWFDLFMEIPLLSSLVVCSLTVSVIFVFIRRKGDSV